MGIEETDGVLASDADNNNVVNSNSDDVHTSARGKDSEGRRFNIVEAHGLVSIISLLKNRKSPALREEEKRSRSSLLGPWVGLVEVVIDWIVDAVVACVHFINGKTLVGALTLFLVFAGGAFVTFNLNVLTRRKGNKELKDTLRKVSPALLCLMYIPSFLPFFSAGLLIYLTYKLRKAKDEHEEKELERKVDICKEHCVVDVYYESCYESFGQACLQLVILLETKTFSHWLDFVPLLGAVFGWIGITMSPIDMAKTLNHQKPRLLEVIAGFANKGVTLLSFALVVTSSRQQFANPEILNWSLVLATVIPVIGLIIFADAPGIILFHITLKNQKRKNHAQASLEFLMNTISILVPVAAMVFWTLVLNDKNELTTTMYYVVGGIFMFGFAVAFLGFCMEENLPWLGQFDTDVLLLIWIGIVSYDKKMKFRDLDFQFERTSTLPTDP